jgi:hypothetical protein
MATLSLLFPTIILRTRPVDHSGIDMSIYRRSLLLSTIVSDSTAILGVNASDASVARLPLCNGHSECNVVGSDVEAAVDTEESLRSFRTRNMLNNALTAARCSAIL